MPHGLESQGMIEFSVYLGAVVAGAVMSRVEAQAGRWNSVICARVRVAFSRICLHAVVTCA